MKVLFDAIAWEQYVEWQTRDRRILKRINLLIRDIVRDDSDDGIGKPELLRGDLSGWSSRRINDEHRLVYRINVETDCVLIAQCRYHYGSH